jgi:hypothetical protein
VLVLASNEQRARGIDMNKFQKWHDELWTLRREIGDDRYPIPDPEDATAWAVTEAAEALDAWLIRRGTWVRNNPEAKHTDEYREWAQCAMMLMLAVGEGYEYEGAIRRDNRGRMWMVVETAFIAESAEGGSLPSSLMIEELLSAIDLHCVGLDRHIEAEFQRLREKWL